MGAGSVLLVLLLSRKQSDKSLNANNFKCIQVQKPHLISAASYFFKFDVMNWTVMRNCSMLLIFDKLFNSVRKSGNLMFSRSYIYRRRVEIEVHCLVGV